MAQDSVVGFFLAAWDTGTFLARIALAILLFWPLLLIATASALTPPLALTVVPMITIACLLIVLLGSRLTIIELGFARYIARVILPYLLVGLYCSFIPLSESKGLVPAVALIWYVILFLFVAGRPRWAGLAALFLTIFSLVYFPGTLATLRHFGA
jgi:hypothetical protein